MLSIARHALFLMVLCFPASDTFAQDYPNKPIRFITGYTPGSASDILARMLGQKLSEAWAQQVVVDNRPGAGGTIASATAAKTLPDGYTILLIAANYVICATLYPNLPFDPVKDFTAVGQVSTSPLVLVVIPSLAVKSAAEFIALAKARPGQLSYGSSGNGSTPHLAVELLKTVAGLDIVHVPYKGIAPAFPDLLSGNIQMMFATIAPVAPLIKSGRLKALAVSSATRSIAAPDIPSLSETLPGFEAATWYGVLAPAGTPEKIVKKLNTALLKIPQIPDARKWMIDAGHEPVGSNSHEFAALVRSEIVKWAGVVKTSGARPD